VKRVRPAGIARGAAIALLVLLPVAAISVVGAGALAVSALLLLIIGARRLVAPSGPRSAGRAGAAAALAGGAVRVAATAAALASAGAVSPYSARAPFGWAALVFALLAAGGGLLAPARPVAAGALMVAGGLAGAVAITLFTVDSWYALALPFLLAGAVLALLPRGAAAPPGRGGSHRPPPAGTAGGAG
jgi:hypothetical protein